MPTEFRTEKDGLYLTSGRTTTLDKVYIALRNTYRRMEKLAAEVHVEAGIAELAQKWATNPEDVEVADGEYSAKHYSVKSDQFRTTASGHATDALGYKNDAEAAAEKALTKIKDKKIVTENYTLLAADKGKMILAEHASTKITITVPNNLFTDFSDGYPMVYIRRSGAAEVEVVSDGDSVVQGGNKIGAQHQTIKVDWKDSSTVTVTGGSKYPKEQYREYTDGVDTFRTGVRARGFVIDKVLTATGFSGVENTDWKNVGFEAVLEYSPLGAITDINPATVAFEVDRFKLAYGVDSFSFKDDGTNKVADFDGTTWIIADWNPAPPFDLEAEAQSDSEIKLTWEHSDFSADGISVERSADGTTYTEIGTVNVTDFEYSDSDIALEEDTQYWYRVRFYKDSDYSDYSNIAIEWTNYSSDYYAIVIKTDNTGDTNNDQFCLPATGTNYDVKWERGGAWEEGLTTEFDATAPAGGDPDLRPITHTYGSAGVYRVLVRNGLERIRFYDSTNPDPQKLLEIQQWGSSELSGGFAMSSAYYQCSNVDLTAKDVPNLTNLGSYSLFGVFRTCSNLQGEDANWDWNTTGTGSFRHMFSGTQANPDVRNWDVSDVTGGLGVDNMFTNSKLNRDLSNWILSTHIEDASNMFENTSMTITNYTRTLIGFANSVHANAGPYNVNFTQQFGMVYDDTVHNDIVGEFNNAVDALEYLEKTVALGGAEWDISGHALWEDREAKTFYIDSDGGNDANDGESDATPWQTVSKVNSTLPVPGDQFLFKRGCTWWEQFVWVYSGDSTNQITYGAYGTGDEPKFSNIIDVPNWNVEGTWTETAVGSNVWTTSLGGATARRVWLDGLTTSHEAARGRTDTLTELTAEYQFHYSAGTLYLYSVGNPATVYSSIKITGGSRFAYGTSLVNYITLQNLDIQGWRYTSVFGCSNWIIEYCNWGWGNTEYGIRFWQHSESNTGSIGGIVRYNTFDSGDRLPETYNPSTHAYSYNTHGGLGVMSYSEDWDVHNNDFLAWGHTSLYSGGNGSNGNEYHHNTFDQQWGDYGRAMGPGGTDISTFDENRPCKYYNNEIYSQGSRSQFGQPYVQVFNNTFHKSSAHPKGGTGVGQIIDIAGFSLRKPYKMKFYNNVLADSETDILGFMHYNYYSGDCEGNEFVNNIFYECTRYYIHSQASGTNFKDNIFKNNIFYSSTTITIRIWTGEAYENISLAQFEALAEDDAEGNPQNWITSGNIESDPLFVDAAAGDFTLAVGSPAIGAGLTPLSATDKAGNTWSDPASIGAYEYQGEGS